LYAEPHLKQAAM